MAAASIALSAAGCSGEATRTPSSDDLQALGTTGRAAGYNLLLVTVDTLRADRLGCYGYREGRTPVIDGLARNGVLFEQSVASAPVTLLPTRRS